MQIALADISGTINIADYILVFTETTPEHDEILKEVFDHFYKKSLTLNLKKCIFSKEHLNYFWSIFSKDGIKPSNSKTLKGRSSERYEGSS